MIKCKEASESMCGKDICCAYCEEKEGCPDVCNVAYEFEENGCDAAYEDSEALVLFNNAAMTIMQTVSELAKQKKELEEQDQKMREELTSLMNQYGIKNIDNDFVKITYKAASTRTSVDSAKLKKEQPDIYNKYLKTSNVKATVVISPK